MRKYGLSEFKEKLVTEVNAFLEESKCGYRAAIETLSVNGTEKKIVAFNELSNNTSEEVLNSNVFVELETLYDCYLNGYSIFGIVASVVEKFLSKLEKSRIILEHFKKLTREDVLRDISVRLLPGDVRTQNGFSYVRNWNGLSVALYVDMKKLGGSLCLTDELLRWYDISADEAFSLAFAKVKEEEYQLFDFKSLNIQMMKGYEPQIPEEELKHMYIYTSLEGYYGTKMVFNTEPLKELAEKLDSDLYLCSSTVHEWLIFSVKELPLLNVIEVHKRMQRVMKQEELLSDSVYIYKRDFDTIGQISLMKMEKEV